MTWRISAIDGSYAAEVHGPPLGQIASADIEMLRDGLDLHGLLILRGQLLDEPTLVAFAKRFGEPMIYPFVKGLEAFPEVTPVIEEKTDTVNFGGLWHTDTAYEQIPPMGSN